MRKLLNFALAFGAGAVLAEGLAAAGVGFAWRVLVFVVAFAILMFLSKRSGLSNRSGEVASR